MKFWSILIFKLLFLSFAALADDLQNQVVDLNNNDSKIYEWRVIRVLDGDTLEIANNFLPSELKLFVRIKNIDTPEKKPRAKCLKEHNLALKASNYTAEAINNAQKNNQTITFGEIKWDKYGGRIVAKVMVNNKDLAEDLVKKGLAKKYDGKKKSSWCY